MPDTYASKVDLTAVCLGQRDDGIHEIVVALSVSGHERTIAISLEDAEFMRASITQLLRAHAAPNN